MLSTMESFTDTGHLIEDTARKVLSAHCASGQLKAAEGAWSEKLWQDLSDTGLTCALEPDGKGELGIPVAEALNILRLAGGFSTPVPLVENMLANWLIQSAGLPSVPGPLSIAPVNREDRLTLKRLKSGWHLSGTAVRVPWARYTTGLVVVAEAEGREFIALVSAGSFAVVHGENLAREPRDTVTFDAVLGEADVLPFEAGFDSVYAMGAAMRVMQIAGALGAVLELSVRYAQDRKQFGKPISKFQAVQQSIAVMAANVAASNAAANSAVRFIEDGGSWCGIAAAKIRANEAATIASKLAHQVHGAMGFTQEYELHFLTKRLWSWRDEFGNESVWGHRLGREVCNRGADQLWALITADMS